MRPGFAGCCCARGGLVTDWVTSLLVALVSRHAIASILNGMLPYCYGPSITASLRMGSGSKPSTKADLFSPQQSRDSSSLSADKPKSSPSHTDEPVVASSQSYALPQNLPSALRYLDDDQLARLLAAVLAEQKRRGKALPVSDQPSRKKPIKEVAPPLAFGKINAVRAAFKAGVTPSRIARRFGISQSDVRKALAGDQPK